MYKEYFEHLEEAKDKCFTFIIGGRHCDKITFLNEVSLIQTGRRVTPMTQQEFSYYTEVTRQRVESLHEGVKLREDVLVDTIYRLSEMVVYLQEGEKNEESVK